jgi:hypothetical protein
MSGQIVKLGLLSLISSALAAPIASPEGHVRRHARCFIPSSAAWTNAEAAAEVTSTSSSMTSTSTVWVQPTEAATTAAATSATAAAEAKIPSQASAYTAASPSQTWATSSSAAPAATSSAASASYSSSGAKGGVAYTSASNVSPFVGQTNIGWCYNWNSSPGDIPSGIEYLPLLWGTQSTFTDSWVTNANAAISKGATAVMGFNEPDDSGQSNLDYNTAATAYKQYITDNFSGKVTLVAPSVTNGGAPMGLTYLQNFMDACSDCGIQAINLHWYDTSSNVDYFKSYIQGAYEQFKLPIWLTEFGTTDGNDQAFLEQVLPWLNSQTYVERYAYFMAEDGKLLSGTGLSAAGETYCSA